MASISRRNPPSNRGGADRPYAFLVSTTGCAKGIRNTIGSAAYSYYFVLEALAPVLEKLGTWRLLDHPESSLPFAADRAEAEGYRPIHLALHPPQDVYLTPALPNVIFPFWEFPDIPDRDFEYDTRQNWARVCRRADMILTACRFTADAFRRGGIDCPIGVVPVPIRPEHFEVPAWDPDHSWTITCRSETWGGPRKTEPARVTVDPAPESIEPVSAEPLPRIGPKRRAFLMARGAFRKIHPWLGTTTLERIARTRHYLLLCSGRSPETMEPLPGARPGLARLAYALARDGYRRFFKRWLSHEALDAITRAKVRALKLIGREPILAPDPLLHSNEVTLSGLVFVSIFNLGDRRKNHVDLLTAYLLAFQDREDVTLVIKLATNPTREHHEMNLLRQIYFDLAILHKCRVVVITEFLSDEQMADLMRVTTYYVNTSKAEGACLPLQQSLAAGRPSIAPDHTAMADFMDERIGFVIRTHPEPTYWPHDPRERGPKTSWQRMVWSDLHDHLLAAASMIEEAPDDYQAMAQAARERMAAYASREVVAEALREALGRLPEIETGRFAWAS